jgi:hypothetical protein
MFLSKTFSVIKLTLPSTESVSTEFRFLGHVSETGGIKYKFLGDVPVAIAAWFKFLHQYGASLPPGPFMSCNIQVYP